MILLNGGYDNGNEKEVYKNVENNVKTLDVTYDDEGNIIPLDKRFDEGNPDTRYSIKDVSTAGATADTTEDAKREWKEKGTDSKYFKKMVRR